MAFINYIRLLMLGFNIEQIRIERARNEYLEIYIIVCFRLMMNQFNIT